MAGGVLQWPTWACGHDSDGPEGKEKHLPTLWFAETSGLLFRPPPPGPGSKAAGQHSSQTLHPSPHFGSQDAPDAPAWAQVLIAYVLHPSSPTALL